MNAFNHGASDSHRGPNVSDAFDKTRKVSVLYWE
jgi:hypothetical protein